MPRGRVRLAENGSPGLTRGNSRYGVRTGPTLYCMRCTGTITPGEAYHWIDFRGSGRWLWRLSEEIRLGILLALGPHHTHCCGYLDTLVWRARQNTS